MEGRNLRAGMRVEAVLAIGSRNTLANIPRPMTRLIDHALRESWPPSPWERQVSGPRLLPRPHPAR